LKISGMAPTKGGQIPDLIESRRKGGKKRFQALALNWKGSGDMKCATRGEGGKKRKTVPERGVFDAFEGEGLAIRFLLRLYRNHAGKGREKSDA